MASSRLVDALTIPVAQLGEFAGACGGVIAARRTVYRGWGVDHESLRSLPASGEVTLDILQSLARASLAVSERDDQGVNSCAAGG